MNETWTDPRTGLEWQVEAQGALTWEDARAYARCLRLGGSDNWRLPAARELESLLDRRGSLLDRGLYRPEMREEVPFRDERSYWSATTFAPATQTAWIVMFDGAYVLSYPKTNAYHVRCVRTAA
jgi:hypothetical protein